MKRVKKALVECSKEEFGNIFVQIETLEDVVKVKEAQFEIMPTLWNRAELSKVEADLKRYLRLEDDFQKQKAEIKWFV